MRLIPDGVVDPTTGGRGRTFLYFAYGSNLLTKRIHFQNPSATFRDAAKLDGYKLQFRLPSEVNVPTFHLESGAIHI